MNQKNSDSPESKSPPTSNLAALFAWVRRREAALLIAAFILQALVLLSMIAAYAAPLLFGETVLLQTQPVDPRSMFRGDYVILSYEFNQTPAHKIEGLPADEDARRGHEVYAWLEPTPGKETHRVRRFSIRPPSSGPYLAGKYVGHQRIEYGIQSYFVQEYTGGDIENAIREGEVLAEVKVWRGQGRVTGLRVR